MSAAIALAVGHSLWGPNRRLGSDSVAFGDAFSGEFRRPCLEPIVVVVVVAVVVLEDVATRRTNKLRD